MKVRRKTDDLDAAQYLPNEEGGTTETVELLIANGVPFSVDSDKVLIVEGQQVNSADWIVVESDGVKVVANIFFSQSFDKLT